MTACGERAILAIGDHATAEVLCGLEQDGHEVHEAVDKVPIVRDAEKPVPFTPPRVGTVVYVWRSQ